MAAAATHGHRAAAGGPVLARLLLAAAATAAGAVGAAAGPRTLAARGQLRLRPSAASAAAQVGGGCEGRPALPCILASCLPHWSHQDVRQRLPALRGQPPIHRPQHFRGGAGGAGAEGGGVQRPALRAHRPHDHPSQG